MKVVISNLVDQLLRVGKVFKIKLIRISCTSEQELMERFSELDDNRNFFRVILVDPCFQMHIVFDKLQGKNIWQCLVFEGLCCDLNIDANTTSFQ